MGSQDAGVDIEYEAIHLIARLKPGMVNATEAAVLYALACYAGYRVINPGLAELSQHTKLHRTAILRALASLEANDLIEIDHFEPGKGQARGTNAYRFTVWDDDWLLTATSSGERLVAQSDPTSSGERPDLINLIERDAYERESGFGIEESEATRQAIPAQGVGHTNGATEPIRFDPSKLPRHITGRRRR